jgi:hypothetical protein
MRKFFLWQFYGIVIVDCFGALTDQSVFSSLPFRFQLHVVWVFLSLRFHSVVNVHSIQKNLSSLILLFALAFVCSVNLPLVFSFLLIEAGY